MKVEDSKLSSRVASRAILWSITTDPVQPYEAKIGADTWIIRLNDFPDERLFTLLINGIEAGSFDGWPAAWSRPEAARANEAEVPSSSDAVQLAEVELAESISKFVRSLHSLPIERQKRIGQIALDYWLARSEGAYKVDPNVVEPVIENLLERILHDTGYRP